VPNLLSIEAEETIGALEALIGREHVSEDYVRFRIDLFKSQVTVCDSLARCSQPTADHPCDQERESIPRINISQLPFDSALGKSMLDRLCTALEARGQPTEDLNGLCMAAGRDPDLLERLALKAACGPDEEFLRSLAQRVKVSFDSLLFFGRALAAPFVTETVRQRSRPATPQATKPGTGNCPWCGSSPGLATLNRENGKRFLCCSLCGEAWESPRIECPFCGSRTELGILSFGEADPHSIATCDACKGYLKTVDERKLPEEQSVLPLVEAVRTLYLDVIAEGESLTRSLPYVALR